ncbi:hypothetical protein BHM03_00017658 [Ensete ventricosum]|nr:hypothetical protein BHM03_00017658 [Ensete ventricosum]
MRLFLRHRMFYIALNLIHVHVIKVRHTGPYWCTEIWLVRYGSVVHTARYGAVHIPVNHRTGMYRLYRTVESAFEFARICRKLDFHNFVFSMKASNPVVMVQAYRLLVAEMYVQGWDYPLHLGVTEAGEGEDGRMKSAIGIGTLLQDGLGDTIRVSLTEPPEEEIDPCRRLANLGMQAVNLQKGTCILVFWLDLCCKLSNCSYFVQGEEVDYRGVLHRDGSVLMSVSLDMLKAGVAFM